MDENIVLDRVTISDDLMTAMEYHRYILSECERQWKECQEETYGTWDSQSDDEKAEYYNSLYSQYTDLLGNACCDCCYAGEQNGKFYCNFGDSENYGKEIHGRNYCDE